MKREGIGMGEGETFAKVTLKFHFVILFDGVSVIDYHDWLSVE